MTPYRTEKGKLSSKELWGWCLEKKNWCFWLSRNFCSGEVWLKHNVPWREGSGGESRPNNRPGGK